MRWGLIKRNAREAICSYKTDIARKMGEIWKPLRRQCEAFEALGYRGLPLTPTTARRSAVLHQHYVFSFTREEVYAGSTDSISPPCENTSRCRLRQAGSAHDHLRAAMLRFSCRLNGFAQGEGETRFDLHRFGAQYVMRSRKIHSAAYTSHPIQPCLGAPAISVFEHVIQCFCITSSITLLGSLPGWDYGVVGPILREISKGGTIPQSGMLQGDLQKP